MKLTNEEHAEAAGYDCGTYGPNAINCHFTLFATEAMAKAWERGKTRAEAAKAKEDRHAAEVGEGPLEGRDA